MELAEVLEEVWLRSKHAEESLRVTQEQDARCAEKDLLESLDAEEGRQARDRKRREKRRQKERQKRRDRTAAKPDDEASEEIQLAPNLEHAQREPEVGAN